MANAIRVYDASNVDGLARHARAWDALVETAPDQLPMLSHAWVTSFVEYNLRQGQTWRCLFVYDSNDLIGVLPVVKLARRRTPGVRLQATFGLHTASGYAPLAAGREPEALSELLRLLSRLEPDYLWLRFCGIRDSAPILSVVGELLGTRVATMPASRFKNSAKGSVLATIGDFSDYEAGLNSNFRRNLKKARNRCHREYESSYRFVAGTDARSTDLLQKFLKLEAAGWKGKAGSAIQRVPRLIAFYSALAERLGERGWLEWHFLELDGAIVAGHLGIRCGRSLVLHKIAYDESFGRLGPGNLLFRETVARAFADPGLDEINCVSDTPWHQNWHMSTIVYSDMVLTPRRPLPMLAGLVEAQTPPAVRRALWSVRR